MADLYGNIPISGEPEKKPPKKKAPPGEVKDGTPKKPHRQPSSKWPIIVPVILLITYAAYYLVSSSLIPYLVEQHFPKLFKENTGLDLSVRESQFNPLDVSLLLGDVTIQTPAGEKTAQADLLFLESLSIDFDLISLLRGSIVSDSVVIENGSLTIIRFTDKTYNISRFFQKDGGRETGDESMNFADLPFLYSFNNISIQDSDITFIDKTADKRHVIDDLSLSLPTLSNFSFDAGTYIQPRFSAVINGSPIEMVGETDTSSPDGEDLPTRLSCSITSLDLSLYSEYLPVPLPFLVVKGIASGKLQVSFLPENAQGRRLTFNYQFQIDNSQIQSHDRAVTLSVPLLNVEGSLDPLKSDIAIQNLLLRDPTLQVGKDFSAKTIDSLVLEGYDKNATDGVPLERPAIRIALLIADNGTVHIDSSGSKDTFSPVQMSMRNFANRRAQTLYDATGESSFRISGESSKDLAVFSWQGKFAGTTPVGELEINNLGIPRILPLISRQGETQGQGSLDIRGTLKLARGEDSPLAYSLSEANASLTNLVLTEDGSTWLQSATGRASGFRLTADSFHLGSLFLEKSGVVVDPENLPSFLRRFNRKDGATLSGLDLQGSIDIVGKATEASPLTFSQAHLQMNSLDSDENRKDNLALTAETNSGGSIKAKGRIALAPLTGTIETAFTNLQLKALLPTDTSISVGQSTSATGTGTLDAATGRYRGSLEVDTGSIATKGGITYGFRKAGSERVTASLDLGMLKAENIRFEEAALDSDGLHIEAERSSLGSLSWNEGNVAISDFEMPSSTIAAQSGFSSLIELFRTKKKTTFTLQDIHVDGNLTLLDDEQAVTSFNEVEMDISSLTTEYPEKTNISFKAAAQDGGRLSATGNLALFPLKSRFELSLAAIPSATTRSFSRRQEEKESYEATLTGEIVHRYPENLLSGTVRLDNGQLYTSDGTTLASWDRAVLEDFKYSQSPKHLGIAHLELDGPRISYTNDGSHIYSAIASMIENRFKNEKNENQSGTVTFSRLDIPRTDIRNGHIDYVDTRMDPAWQTEITSITGFVNDFHLTDTGDPIVYGARGDIAGASLSINETILPADGTTTKEISYSLENLSLAAIEQQVESSIAAETDQARLDLHYFKKEGTDPVARVEFSHITANDPDTPLAMTLALLSRDTEKLSQSIAIEENRSSTFEQIIRHFQRLTVKANVSPYLLLPSPYDQLLENNTLSFPPGSNQLSGSSESVLEMYGLLVEDYPRLRLDLSSLVDRSVDSKALKTRLEKEEMARVERQNEQLLRQWQQRQAERKASSPPSEGVVENEIVEEELEAFAPVSAKPVRITDDMLRELGRQRIEAVHDFLLDKQAVPKENMYNTEEVNILEDAPFSGVAIQLNHIDAHKE